MSAPDDVAAAAQAIAAALLGATVNPADALDLLEQLADFTPRAMTTSSAIGIAQATMQGACGDLFRRSAVIALARASSLYQPSSYDDAIAVRDRIADLLDAEITIAGDQGEDASYQALRELRQAVVADLAARGANLAAVQTVSTRSVTPALSLAQRLYQDPGRSDDLVAQGNPRHPAFMPASFRALSS